MRKIAILLVVSSTLLAGCVSPEYCSGGDVHAGKCTAAVAADVVLVPLAIVGYGLAAMGEAERQAERDGVVTCNTNSDGFGNSNTQCVPGYY